MAQIANHAHCRICSRAITFGEEACSPECQAKIDDLKERQRKTKRFYYVTIAVLVLLFIWQVVQPLM